MEKAGRYAEELSAGRPSEERSAQILRRLENLPMTTAILRETGIGRALRSLKDDPEVGPRAKALIRSWKQLAEQEVQAPAKPPPAPSQAKPPKAKAAAAPPASKPSSSKGAEFTPDSGMSFDAIMSMKAPVKKAKKRPVAVEASAPVLAGTYRPSAESYWEGESGEVVHKSPSKKRDAAADRDRIDVAQFQSKKARTAVQAGKKGKKCVESLFEMCLKVVGRHVDALEDTGDIPFAILEPALRRATPAQLAGIEDRNPLLAEDSGALWEEHARREFAKELKEEEEVEEAGGWRAWYEGRARERRQRLAALSQRVSASAAATQPVRLAKTMVHAKAPRDVRRKQIQSGLAFRAQPAALPSSEAIAEAKRSLDRRPADSAAKPATAVFRVAAPEPSAASNFARSAHSSGRAKKVKGPLMAKIKRQISRKR